VALGATAGLVARVAGWFSSVGVVAAAVLAVQT